MPCGGDPAQICGGISALSVYNDTAFVAPRQPSIIPSVGSYTSLGCYTEGVSERALADNSTATWNMTVQSCVGFCLSGGYKYAGIEYSTECYCGAVIAGTASPAPAAECGMLCGGDKYAYCGGPSRLNVYANLNVTTSSVTSSRLPTSSPTSTSGSVTSTVTTTTSTGSSVPSQRPEYTYLGCANEGTTGRALTKDVMADKALTPALCQDYCTSKGHPLSGMEYSVECYCGSTLENGSTIGGSTACVMPCGGNPDFTCGGPGALSVYNNTAMAAPKQPVTVPNVGSYISQGCYTEGTNERALAGTSTAFNDMTVQECVKFCREAGYKYAGVEYSIECFCGATVAGTAKSVPAVECGMVCGGDKYAYCGGPYRLNVYANLNGTAPGSGASGSLISSSTTTSPTSTAVSGTNSGTSSASVSITTSSSTSSSPTASASSSASWIYLGCANETNPRALSGARTVSKTMTPTACQDFCLSKSFPLAGLEYGSECYCGNVLQNRSHLNQTGCSTRCSGDPSSFCGGPSRLSVYNNTLHIPTTAIVRSVGTYNYTGCYAEPAKARALAGLAYTNDSLTVEICVRVCEDARFAYAGAEYGRECYCGSAIAAAAEKVDDAECRVMACAGDRMEYCGAGRRVVVYTNANVTAG